MFKTSMLKTIKHYLKNMKEYLDKWRDICEQKFND